MKPLIFNQSDLVDASRLNFLQIFRSKKGKKIINIIVISFVLCFILIGLQGFPFSGFGVLLALIGMLSGASAIWFTVIPNNAKNLIKTPQFSMPLDIHWDEHYLYSSNADINSKSNWHTFSKIVENDSYLLLYSQSCMFHIFPKRFFDSEDELQDFKNHALKGITDYHLKNDK